MTDMRDELEAIRARHNLHDIDRQRLANHQRFAEAHTDRATLLRLLDAARAELDAVREAAKDALEYGRSVMRLLEKEGGDIVPHLMDTDDNSGQRFRVSLLRLAAALKETDND